MNEGELQGKVSLVTGASRGIGRAIARKLSQSGSKVAINCLSSDEEANALMREIENGGGEALLAKADVADSGEVEKMIQEIADKWGGIDILVNNAGSTKDALLIRMSEEDWDKVINTDLRGPYLCTKFALPFMIKRAWGRIVNISSVVGIMGNVGQANYSAAKGGLISFTKSVAQEVASRNITVNAVAPGFIKTSMTESLRQEVKEAYLSRIPLRRFGKPEEVAELVVFLVTERASYITGQVICIDGGLR